MAIHKDGRRYEPSAHWLSSSPRKAKPDDPRYRVRKMEVSSWPHKPNSMTQTPGASPWRAGILLAQPSMQLRGNTRSTQRGARTQFSGQLDEEVSSQLNDQAWVDSKRGLEGSTASGAVEFLRCRGDRRMEDSLAEPRRGVSEINSLQE